jgi:hypothetical protein
MLSPFSRVENRAFFQALFWGQAGPVPLQLHFPETFPETGK